MTRLELFAVNHDQHLFRGRGAKNFAEATARPQMVRLIKYPERLTDPLRLSVPALLQTDRRLPSTCPSRTCAPTRPPCPGRSQRATSSSASPSCNRYRSSLPVYNTFPSRLKFSIVRWRKINERRCESSLARDPEFAQQELRVE